MDTTIVTQDNTNYTVISFIVIFLVLLLIIAGIVIIIFYVVPRNDAQEFQSCVAQSDCSNGLVCSKGLDGKNQCLGGLNQACNSNTDCASEFVCQANSAGVKLCMNKPATTLTLQPSIDLTTFVEPMLFQTCQQPLVLSQTSCAPPLVLSQAPCHITNPPCTQPTLPTCLQPRVTQTTCHQTKTTELKPAHHFNYNDIYNTIRNVDCHFTNKKKALTCL